MSWQNTNGKLYKKFEFKNYEQTLDFVNKVAEIAKKANHHPDIYFGYNYCNIELFSHDQNKITQKDYVLSDLIDSIELK